MGNTLVLVLDSGNLHPNQEYVFSLEVREGIRKSYAEQNVFVLDGPVPSLDLRWVEFWGREGGGVREGRRRGERGKEVG
jgi:hypothetical protein